MKPTPLDSGGIAAKHSAFFLTTHDDLPPCGIHPCDTSPDRVSRNAVPHESTPGTDTPPNRLVLYWPPHMGKQKKV